MSGVARRGAVVVLVGLLAAACASGTSRPTTAPPTALGRCVVFLHGKGAKGAPEVDDGPVATLSPDGNADGWGARQWLYDSDARFAQALAVVRSASEPCARVILHGFSNGGAFAAKLVCRGETLDGRLVGVVVDDPVPDHGVEPCAPAAGVKVALYWTGALTQAVAGWSCAAQDWTCEGGTTIGIDAYAAKLGAAVQPSPQTQHAPDAAAPELTSWW